MTAMVLMLKWLCALLAFISVINIIAAISWLPSLISELLSPRLLKATPCCFDWITLHFVLCKALRFVFAHIFSYLDTMMIIEGKKLWLFCNCMFYLTINFSLYLFVYLFITLL